MFDDLRIRPVDRRRGRLVQVGLADIAGHANDLTPDVLDRPGRGTAGHRRPFVEANPASDRILAREDLARQRVADDRDRRRSPRVLLAERTPSDERDAHRGEVVWADQNVAGARRLPRRQSRTPVDGKTLLAAAVYRRP